MNSLLYKIPETLVGQINSGSAELVGAMIKDAATGRILAHVQQTGAAEKLLGSVASEAFNMATNGFSPLSVLTAVQNHRIGKQLGAIQSSLGIIENLQVTNLAVSGLGLGVSVAGFAVMMNKLQKIDARIEQIGAEIEAATAARREDDIRTILADVRADLATIGSLSQRTAPRGPAERAQEALARSANRLQNHSSRILRQDVLGPGDVELLWTISAATRLCTEAGVHALMHADETRTAEDFARKQAQDALDACKAALPETIIQRMTRTAADLEEVQRQREAFYPQATMLFGGYRDTIAQLESQAEIANQLTRQGASGRAYMIEAEEETEEPFLMLEAA